MIVSVACCSKQKQPAPRKKFSGRLTYSPVCRIFAVLAEVLARLIPLTVLHGSLASLPEDDLKSLLRLVAKPHSYESFGFVALEAAE